jgi:glycosyltransferase involved in cell wall biosynthesis
MIRLFLARLADAVVFYDQVQADQFAERGYPRERIYVARNSIDTQRIAELSQRYNHRSKSRLLFVGRLIREKKVDCLLRAFALALPELRTVRKLTIVGAGPDLPRLTALARALAISEHVEFVGELTAEEDLAPYFCSALASVSPGYVGLSAVHALAYGVPMIAGRDEPHRPEVSLLVDGKTALFVGSDDPTALAAAILRLELSPELRNSLANQGAQLVEKELGIDQMVGSLVAAIAGF